MSLIYKLFSAKTQPEVITGIDHFRTKITFKKMTVIRGTATHIFTNFCEATT